MPKSTLVGHPAHPILVTVPIGLLPFSFVMDAAYLCSGNQNFAKAAKYSLWGGFIGGAIAAVTGALDYLSIPSRTEAKRVANVHALLNIGVMAGYAVNLLARQKKPEPTALSTLISGLGTAGIIASSWYGGTLVYEHGMRVVGLDPIAAARDVSFPGDEAAAEALHKAGKVMTSAGPTVDTELAG